MAPEIIKNEPCSDKVDVWSYGVIVWELLTLCIPYKNVDYSAIMWGVGSSSLSLPIPETCSDGVKLLLKLCWSAKPRNRPSFLQILKHIDITQTEISANYSEDEYLRAQKLWQQEIDEIMEAMRTSGTTRYCSKLAIISPLGLKRTRL